LEVKNFLDNQAEAKIKAEAKLNGGRKGRRSKNEY